MGFQAISKNYLDILMSQQLLHLREFQMQLLCILLIWFILERFKIISSAAKAFIKNHYGLTTVDLIRQKELDADPKPIKQIEFVGQFKKARW